MYFAPYRLCQEPVTLERVTPKMFEETKQLFKILVSVLTFELEKLNEINPLGKKNQNSSSGWRIKITTVKYFNIYDCKYCTCCMLIYVNWM